MTALHWLGAHRGGNGLGCEWGVYTHYVFHLLHVHFDHLCIICAVMSRRQLDPRIWTRGMDWKEWLRLITFDFVAVEFASPLSPLFTWEPGHEDYISWLHLQLSLAIWLPCDLDNATHVYTARFTWLSPCGSCTSSFASVPSIFWPGRQMLPSWTINLRPVIEEERRILGRLSLALLKKNPFPPSL